MSSTESLTSNDEDDERTWQERYSRLQEDYEKLVVRVITLAQQEYPICDNKIIKKYRQIRNGIDIWIDELRGEAVIEDFNSRYQSHLKSRNRGEIFASFGFPFGGRDVHWEETIGRLRTCMCIILGLTISNFLKEFLGRDYPLGVTNSQMMFLKQMEASSRSKGMPSLKSLPSASLVSNTKTATTDAMFHRWRGETISPIEMSPEFTKHCEEDSHKVFKKLKANMSQWLSSSPLGKHAGALRALVLQPAVEFHRMIHCSGKNFNFDWHKLLKTSLQKDNAMQHNGHCIVESHSEERH